MDSIFRFIKNILCEYNDVHGYSQIDKLENKININFINIESVFTVFSRKVNTFEKKEEIEKRERESECMCI